jgi:hypothetical protein
LPKPIHQIDPKLNVHLLKAQLLQIEVENKGRQPVETLEVFVPRHSKGESN